MRFYTETRGRWNSAQCQAATPTHHCDSRGQRRENGVRMCAPHWNLFKRDPDVEWV